MSNVVKFLISVNDEDDEGDDDVTNGDDVWRTCDENRTGNSRPSLNKLDLNH